MGVLDKLKNALFEVEYVEVDEPPKKEKKVKEKPKKEKKEKPIAKKVVLPGKREKKEKKEEIKEEIQEAIDEPITEEAEEVMEKTVPIAREEFKFADDKDFIMDEDEDDFLPSEEPEILQVIEEEHEMVEERPQEMNRRSSRVYEEEVEEDYYVPQEETYSHNSKPYGMDNSYDIPVHEYGTYEKREERSYFKPSPIISPIYGILDKNYKKEDVVSKKEVRLTSSYSRSNLSVDDIRNKAYGRESERKEESSFEIEDEDNDTLLVDLSDKAKPEVKELTMGDAEEYFEDLGLEYNVDYVDVSKEKSSGNLTKPAKEIDEKPVKVEKKKEVKQEVKEEPKEEPIKEKQEEKKKDIIEDDDSLFDLIDSMYQEEE